MVTKRKLITQLNSLKEHVENEVLTPKEKIALSYRIHDCWYYSEDTEED